MARVLIRVVGVGLRCCSSRVVQSLVCVLEEGYLVGWVLFSVCAEVRYSSVRVLTRCSMGLVVSL